VRPIQLSLACLLSLGCPFPALFFVSPQLQLDIFPDVRDEEMVTVIAVSWCPTKSWDDQVVVRSGSVGKIDYSVVDGSLHLA
jgi:hypothetical protein